MTFQGALGLIYFKKSQTRYCIEAFYNIVETQFHTTIKGLRSDNGLKFQMIEFFNQKGIIHQKICVATPRQNEVAERKHQHFLNIARALKTQSNHPNIYWNDCILTTAHIINHVSNPLLSNKTPYELLFNSPTSYCHMRILGCLCFASSLSHIRKKFDSQGRSYVLLGYHFGIKCINS